MLVSDNGSIGTSTSNPVTVDAAQLTMQAKTSGQNVYVNDITTGNVTLLHVLDAVQEATTTSQAARIT